jgi:putative oxygen-independent coproporphyrinogen III oxidase
MPAPFALYVHVPYCRHVCPYCDFNVVASASPPEAGYVATLVAEMRTYAADETWRGRRVRTIYLGGGTPSLFSPGGVAALLEAAAQHFGIEDAAEITLEANPGTVTPASLAGYAAAGVNRLSLGAQSFHPALLKTLGRDHQPDDTRDAVAAARAAGLTNTSLDLIFAVPGATLEDWRADLRTAIALVPEHVSAYALTYEAGTPFHAWRATGRVRAADDDLEAAMAEATCSMLGQAGYARYEISSWARPGFASRHNQSYWDGTDYLGLGAGAHSFAVGPPARRWANERPPEAYRASVAGAGTAVSQKEHLSVAQAESDAVITGLRRLVGVDAAGFARRFGRPLEVAFPQLARLVEDGLLERAGERVRLTSRGLAFADSVAASLL